MVTHLAAGAPATAGVTLWEILERKRPFENVTATGVQVD